MLTPKQKFQNKVQNEVFRTFSLLLLSFDVLLFPLEINCFFKSSKLKTSLEACFF